MNFPFKLEWMGMVFQSFLKVRGRSFYFNLHDKCAEPQDLKISKTRVEFAEYEYFTFVWLVRTTDNDV